MRGPRRVEPALLIVAVLVIASALVLVALTVGRPAQAPGRFDEAQSGAVRLVAYQGADLLGGERVELASVIGRGRPVVLNFFAGLCPPCRAEMPAFERVWARHSDEVLIVGADIGPFLDLGTHADARRLLAELGITYPAAYVEENPVAQFRIVGMPTTILYDAAGRIVDQHTGILTETQLEQAVVGLIGS